MKNMFLCLLYGYMLTFFGITNGSDPQMQSLEKIENLMGQKEAQMNRKNNHTPKYLYKIVSPEEWQDSLRKNQVVTSPMDKDFIHLATEGQLAHVIQKFWNGKSYIVLKLDSKKMSGRLICETNPGGTNQYYHLYEGSIPLDAVIEASSTDLKKWFE